MLGVGVGVAIVCSLFGVVHCSGSRVVGCINVFGHPHPLS
jgi:hypothetical protein